jgi:hypothetical protein
MAVLDEPLEFRADKASFCFPDFTNPSALFCTVALAAPPTSLIGSGLSKHELEEAKANSLGEPIIESADVFA